jgi:hypothetical protein
MPRGYQITFQWKHLKLLAGRVGHIGVGMPGAGMGIPSSGSGGKPRGVEASQGDVAAHKVYPQSAVYKREGSESTVQLGD